MKKEILELDGKIVFRSLAFMKGTQYIPSWHLPV